MNKMLEALQRLQDEANSALDRSATENRHAVRRAGTMADSPPKRKFNVSSWQASTPAAEVPTAAIAPEVPVTPPVVASTPPRFESPWERSARHDLANPAHARAYQTVLQRWQDDLPGEQPRAVMIVGIGCEESDVAEFALRLAMEQAKRGAATLLVDGEPSRWLSNALVAHDQPGLAEAFAEGIPPRHFLQPTFTPDLKFLPGGANGPDPLRNSAALARLVHDLKTLASWTVVSGAGAGSLFAADLARACDAVYLLVRLGTATNLDSSRVRQHLQGAGARLLGCIALENAAV